MVLSLSTCADDRVNFKVYREDISDVAVSETHCRWILGPIPTH